MKESLKLKISLCVVLFINFLFLTKYAYRFTDLYLILAIGITLVQYVAIKKSSFLFSVFQKINISPFFFISSFLLVLVLIAFKIPLDSLNIDRWSVTDSFWKNYFNNLYAYEAKSFAGNYPGPMPFYFLLMLPFYWINEYSYVTAIGAILLFYIFKMQKSNSLDLFKYSLVVASSFIITYEIIARSNIFFNGVLIVLSLLLLFQKKWHLKNLIFKGTLVGLSLSTRNVFVIPIALGFMYLFFVEKQKIYKLFIIGIVAVLTFITTFIPFIYNHFDKFLNINPFIIQSSFLMPKALSFFCIIFSMGFIFCVKNKFDVYFYSGISLFLTIISYYIFVFTKRDFVSTFFESYADITYFILCVPFFIYYLISIGANSNKLSN